jgi:FdhD protein
MTVLTKLFGKRKRRIRIQEMLATMSSSSHISERNRPSLRIAIEKVSGETSSTAQDSVAIEEPLEIQLAYGPEEARKVKSITVTMRTPGNDSELAAGFLLTEGVIRDAADIASVINSLEVSSGNDQAEDHDEALATEAESILPRSSRMNVVRVELASAVVVNLSTLERNFYTTSSCGICGKASLLALRAVCPPRYVNNFSIRMEVLHALPGKLRDAQQVFEQTGGLHGVGLFDAQGKLWMLREDVGRHNAVDKLLGAQFLADLIPMHDKLLLLSGRASFELLQKAVMAGLPMVASVGAPSSLAVQVAREFDIILVGFLRDNRFNIYHGANHINTSI